MKKLLLISLLVLSTCSDIQYTTDPTSTLRSGVYATLLYLTEDPADSIYSRTNSIQLLLDEEDGQWTICTMSYCLDTIMTEEGILQGINNFSSSGKCENYAFEEAFTLWSYPDGTNNIIEGTYSFFLTDCSPQYTFLEAYVFGKHIDSIIE